MSGLKDSDYIYIYIHTHIYIYIYIYVSIYNIYINSNVSKLNILDIHMYI